MGPVSGAGIHQSTGRGSETEENSGTDVGCECAGRRSGPADTLGPDVGSLTEEISCKLTSGQSAGSN